MAQNKQFSSIRVPKPNFNTFDLSCERKLSFQIGHTVPVLWMDITPNDRVQCASELFVRLAPTLAPLMHRIDVYMHYFFVPYRLIWEDWEDFITGGEDGTASPIVPYVTYDNTNKTYFDKGKLSDYMGIPPTASTISYARNLNMLPFRAYWQVVNDWFLRRGIDTEISFSKASGDQSSDYYNNDDLRARRLRGEYIYDCNPYAQQTADKVELDLDVESSRASLSWETLAGAQPAAGDVLFTGASKSMYEAGSANAISFADGNVQSLKAVLEIDEFRQALALQRYLELNAIGGSRYSEILKSRYGIANPSDARLMEAEYLGGSVKPMQISEVIANNTVLDSTDTVVENTGDMAGKGITIGKTKRVNKWFEEHGILLGVLSVMPRQAFQEQIERYWAKFDKTDFYQPEFARLGEQEVLNHEVWWDGTYSASDGIFGYQNRYAEYKYNRSFVSGDFIDDYDFWHMGRVFGSQPTLNSAFITCENTDYDRVFAVTTGSVHKLYAHIYHDIKAIRPMPVTGALPI